MINILIGLSSLPLYKYLNKHFGVIYIFKQINKSITCLFLFFIMFSFSSTLSFADDSFEAVITFESEIENNIISENNITILKRYENLNSLLVNIDSSAFESLNMIKGLVIEKNQHIKTAPVQEGSFNHANLNSSIKNHNYTGEGVKVAVMDSGIAVHEKLTVSGGVSFADENALDYRKDLNGHGTHVAGIIAGQGSIVKNFGVAPNVDLYSIKVTDELGYTTFEKILDGLEWAINHDIDILNMSLGWYTDSTTIESVLQTAYEKNILIIAAAGNEAYSYSGYPARYPSVISVSSLDHNKYISSFSNYGETIEFSAFGEFIYSTYLNDSYAFLSGTSMAAPYVTAVFALYKEAYPHLTNNELRKLLQRKAVDLGVTGRDEYYGFGFLNSSIDFVPIPKLEITSQLNDNIENLRGTTEPYNYVYLYKSNELVEITSSDSKGNFFFGINPIIGDTYQLQAINNQKNKSERLEFVIKESEDWLLFKEKQNVSQFKVWDIGFNTELDSTTLNNENIYLLDENQNKVIVSITPSTDLHSFKIKHNTFYEYNRNYTLYISDRVLSNEGIPLKDKIKFTFHVGF